MKLSRLNSLVLILLSWSVCLPQAGAQYEALDQWPLLRPSPVCNLAQIKDILNRAEADQGRLLSKQQLVERLLVAVPGGKDDPVMGENFLVMTKIGMLAYPRSFLCLLLQKNCHVFVAPFVVVADKSLVGQRPEGYPAGSTYLNCRAVFTTKGILIGSHFYKDGRLLPNLDPLHGVQHEMAHAIDQLLGRPSLTPQFDRVYRQDEASVAVEDRGPLYYYLQTGRVGRIETFGQLLAHKYCHFTEHHTLSLVRCFPDCVRFIDHTFPPDQPASGNE